MRNHYKKNTRKFAAILLAGVLAIGANTAFAGEVNGNGKVVPGGAKGKSECSYSGLEDEPVEPGTTQSWGSLPKAVRDILTLIGVHPGTSCNPTKADD